MLVAGLSLGGVGSLAGASTGGTTKQASALSEPASSCAKAQLRVVASTDHPTYALGAIVKVRATIHNLSSKACRIFVGATSPTFTIYNAQGVAQWSYCSSLVKPEACPLYFRVVNLVPRGSFTTSNAWKPPMSPATSKELPGLYRLTDQFNGVTPVAESTFSVGSSSFAPLIVTDADGGAHVILRVGQGLDLRLATSTYRWSTPSSSNDQVLVATPSSTTTFLARRVGEAVISSTGTPNCYPGCMLPSRIFQVTVSVAT